MQVTRPVMTPHSQQGATLLESLIAILIFSSALLALMGLQAFSIKNSIDAKFRADASFLANQIIGEMWTDKGNLGSYDGVYAPKTAWIARIGSTLPNGDGTIAIDGSAATVTVTWQTAGQDAHNHVVIANINHND